MLSTTPLDTDDAIDALTDCRRVLILSPHPDDVAYSLGGSVERFPQDLDWTILTVFGQSLYVQGEPDARTIAGVSLIREKEEALYVERVGAELVQLRFPDASVLGHTAQSELEANFEDERFEAVCAAIDEALAALRPDRIVAPLALCGHVDHRIVHEAIKLSPNAPRADVLYYEDLPYVWRLSQRDLIKEVNVRLKGNAVPLYLNITGTMAGKLDALSLYRSQLTAADRVAVISHAARVQPELFQYAERLWSQVWIN